MKKFLIILISFLVLIAIVIGFLWTMRAKLVAGYLSRQIGAKVKIASIDLGDGQIEMTGFSIHTPSDPIFPVPFSLDYLRVSASFWELVFRDAKEIEEIYLRDAFVGVHLYNESGTQNNWTALLNNMQKQMKQKDKKEKEEVRFIIDQLFIQNAVLALKRPGQDVKRYPPLNIKLKNIGSDEPASLTKIVKLIIAEIVRQLTIKYGLQKLFGQLLNPENWLRHFGDSLKNFPKKFPFFGLNEEEKEFQEGEVQTSISW